MALGLRIPLLALVVVGLFGCRRDITPPAVPLTLDVQARTVDGLALPVWIDERPGTGAHFTSYYLHLTPDGLWNALGFRYPGNSTPADTSFFQDNGVYTFDGTSLVLHSNSQHTDWIGIVRGDTITATGMLAIADAPHTLVLWP